MKKMKLKNNRRKKYKFKLLLLFFIFILSLYFMFKYLTKINIKINNEELVHYLLNDYTEKDIVNEKISKSINDFFMPDKLLNMKLVYKKEKTKVVIKEENTHPLVYIYNTHETEEYASSTIAEYSVRPNVSINNYIMKDILEKNNINTLIKKGSITDIRKINGWNYNYCYKASRILMEEAKKENESLKYFIDIHRDSLPKDKTTISINGKNFAKVLFIVGLENSNYKENLYFTEKINNKINEKYEGLSKGIYKKEGPGVNGVYNQDFSPYTILIEVGGEENNVEEVMNTMIEVSKIISEVIIENENKEYS
ncbi:MAG: stage II sporulation protein P [Bacilli bacterium]|nr:stage II sporulation protein P [Bacilli bacterium]